MQAAILLKAANLIAFPLLDRDDVVPRLIVLDASNEILQHLARHSGVSLDLATVKRRSRSSLAAALREHSRDIEFAGNYSQRIIQRRAVRDSEAEVLPHERYVIPSLLGG